MRLPFRCQENGVSSTKPVNQLLEYLPDRERDRILEHCEPVELLFGDILCEPDQPYKHVYFPVTAFISLLSIVDAHPPLEVGLIGHEGMLGATLVLRVGDAPLRGMVQGPGSALKLAAPEFQRLLRENPALVSALNRYLFVTITQLAQTVACTHFHEVDKRLARWLLLTHDRSHADHFHLTHQYLADMLGVQRSAVTIAAGSLQKRNIIRYTRGEINVLNRKELEAVSCECYEAEIEDYERYFTVRK